MCECYCCGRLFSRPRRVTETRGECFGFPARETLYGCPYCGGGFGEAPLIKPGSGRRFGDD